MSPVKTKEEKCRLIRLENIKKIMKNLFNKKKWLSWKKRAIKFSKRKPILSLYLAIIIGASILIFLSQIIRDHNNKVRERQRQEELQNIREENTYVLEEELYERVITFNGLFDIVAPEDEKDFDNQKKDDQKNKPKDDILLDELNKIDSSIKNNEMLKVEFGETKTRLNNIQADNSELNSPKNSNPFQKTSKEEEKYVVLKPGSKMIAKAKVPADYFNSISFGLNATVTDIDSKYEFSGTVSRINPRIDSSKNSFYLEIRLDTEPVPHLVDKIAQVKIKTLARPMFLVPKEYIHFDNQERPYVFIDGQKKHVIATLENDGRYRIVFEGIADGVKLEKYKEVIEK
ncbi:MAG: HlyD family efflux transporter periplasmic adaptor subunit [Candidatus Moranbacteria bacterium]|nr:HlyD family efflux transporter periplasmic adaptor subunit [Candidatus Moranbacteria bacterium]